MRVRSAAAGAVVTLLVIWFHALHTGHGVRHTGTTEPETTGHETGRSGALEALDFWTRARAYPNPDISPGKFYAAYLHSMQQVKSLAQSSQSSSSW